MVLVTLFLEKLDKEVHESRQLLVRLVAERESCASDETTTRLWSLASLILATLEQMAEIVERDALATSLPIDNDCKDLACRDAARLVRNFESATLRARRALSSTTDLHLKTTLQLIDDDAIVSEIPRHSMITMVFGRLALYRGEFDTCSKPVGWVLPAVYDSSTDMQVNGDHAAMFAGSAMSDDSGIGNSGRRHFLKSLAALGLAGAGAAAGLAHAATLGDARSQRAVPMNSLGGSPDIVNVKDYGATGDGSTNDTAAFQAALAVSRVIFVPPGDYILSPSFEIERGTHIFGVSTRGASAADYPTYPASRLILSGDAASGFYSVDGSSLLTHGSLRNLVIQAAQDARINYIIDFRGTVGWTFQNLSIQNAWIDGGGMRSRALSSNQITWVNRAIDVVVRVDDASSRFSADLDWSDSNLIGCQFTGGRGARWRGHGHMKIDGCHFDRGSYAGLTLRREVASAGKLSIVGCSFDINAQYGIHINANTSAGESAYGTMIVGCGFRNPGAISDIVFVSHPTQVIRGVIVACNVFTDGVTPWGIDNARWEAVFGLNYSNVAGYMHDGAGVSRNPAADQPQLFIDRVEDKLKVRFPDGTSRTVATDP